MTSEVSSMLLCRVLVFGLYFCKKMAAKPKSDAIVILSWGRVEWYTFCLVEVNIKADFRGQGRDSLISWLELGRSSCISVYSGAHCHHNGAFLVSISKFDRTLSTKKRWWHKTTPVTSSVITHQKKNEVCNHVTSVLKQDCMCIISDYIIYVARWAIPALLLGLIMGKTTGPDPRWPACLCNICKTWLFI